MLVLRIKAPDLPRPFRAPAVAVIAPLGTLAVLFLMAGLPLATWLRFLVWLVIGIVFYGLYGMRHSRLQRQAVASSAV